MRRASRKFPEIGGCGKVYSVTVLFPNLPLVRLARWAYAKAGTGRRAPLLAQRKDEGTVTVPKSFCRKGAPSYATASLRLVFH